MQLAEKRQILAVAGVVVLGAVAAALFVALGGEAVIAGPEAAPSAAPPNPGHSWNDIGDFPGTMWHSNNDGPGSGLDADMLDGMQTGQSGTNYIPYADASGNVGIGTTSPGANLDIDSGGLDSIHVKQTIGNTEGLEVFNYLDNSIIMLTAAGSFQQGRIVLADGLSGSWNIDLMASGVSYLNGGNVGIGTTSPQSALQVDGYLQLALTAGQPPVADCDNAAEEGRMKFDPGADKLYICSGVSGWVSIP